ncbi:MAG: hypothetical protein FJ271_21725 [Planctomycetes bacterium]|nr:hypothetical protein [Planctomycetota bacterium]
MDDDKLQEGAPRFQGAPLMREPNGSFDDKLKQIPRRYWPSAPRVIAISLMACIFLALLLPRLFPPSQPRIEMDDQFLLVTLQASAEWQQKHTVHLLCQGEAVALPVVFRAREREEMKLVRDEPRLLFFGLALGQCTSGSCHRPSAAWNMNLEG